MSTPVIDRLARALERRLDRRGFLARGALGGTALAVAPVDYALRPIDAYAAICRCNNFNCDCNSLCCDGYTEFCCTLNGLNRCPPGSVVAGWWKVDNSNFCGGAPRYYMDCNAGCGTCGCGPGGLCAGSCSGTGCGCALGDCNKRRAGCVQFRYGQCNQQIACVGPIICRLVSCIPPWQIEPTCTTTVAVDEATRFHTGPCLHGGRGSIDVVTRVERGLRIQGWALDPNSAAALQIRVLLNGRLVATGVADRERTDLLPFFPGVGPNHGFDLVVPASPGGHSIEVFAVQTFPAGDIVRLAATVAGLSRPFGSLDVISRVPGGVRVEGWLIDPTTEDLAHAHVYVDGKLTEVLLANRERADVTAAFPGFGTAHGFDGVVKVEGDGNRTICVYGYAAGNPANSALLACRTMRVSSTPFGALDVVSRVPGGVRVAGWAIDPDIADPIDVHIYVNGALAQVERADESRTDVGRLFRYGDNHGYDVRVPLGPGRHEVCVYAINPGAGSNPLLGCGSITVNSAPVGSFDAVARVNATTLRVTGWTIDPDTVDPIDVHIYADNTLVGGARADRARTDVAAAFPQWGALHGFDAMVTVSASARTICVYAINRDAGSNTLLSCKGVV